MNTPPDDDDPIWSPIESSSPDEDEPMGDHIMELFETDDGEFPHPEDFPSAETVAGLLATAAAADEGLRVEELRTTRDEAISMANACREAFVDLDYVAEHRGLLPSPVRGQVYDTSVAVAELNSWLRAYADQLDSIVQFIDGQEMDDAE